MIHEVHWAHIDTPELVNVSRFKREEDAAAFALRVHLSTCWTEAKA